VEQAVSVESVVMVEFLVRVSQVELRLSPVLEVWVELVLRLMVAG
jgi:hypothetical protein